MANFLQVGLKLEDQFTAGINKAASSFVAFKGTLQSAAGGVSTIAGGIGKALDLAFAPLRGLASAATSIRGIIAAFGAAKFGEFAGQVGDIDRSFANLSKSIGSLSDDTLTKLRAATKGTVSDFNLMLTANRAILLGAAQNDEQLTVLAETARRLGRAMGRDTTEAFNDLSLGIGRQSRLILDNLGIIVDVEQAHKDYAQTLGKSADELTEVEKRQGFWNAVMEGSERRIATLGPEVEGLSDSYGRLTASLANLSQDLIRGFSPLLTDVFERIAGFLKDEDKFFNFFIDLAAAADKAMPKIISWIETLGAVISTALAPFQKLTEFFTSTEHSELLKQRARVIYGAADALGIDRFGGSELRRAQGDPASDRPDDVLNAIHFRAAHRIDFGQVRPEVDEEYYQRTLKIIKDIDGLISQNEATMALLKTGQVDANALGPSQGVFGDIAKEIQALRERRQRQRADEASLAAFQGPPLPPEYLPSGDSFIGPTGGPPPDYVDYFQRQATDATSEFQRGIDGAVAGLEVLKTKGLDTFAQIRDLIVDIGSSLADNFTAGIVSAIEGTVSLKDAFRSMAKAILTDLAKIIVRMAAVRLIGAAASGISGLVGPREIDSSLTDRQYQQLGPRTGDYGTDPNAPIGLFDSGGIATQPSIFAERRPEAAVPLIPGTREIPVRLYGPGQGGGTTINVFKIDATDAQSFERLFARGAIANKDLLASLNLRQYQDNPRLQAGYG